MRKVNIELSFDDIVLLKLGLSKLRETYSSYVEEFDEEGVIDGSADFIEAITRINKLDGILHI